MSVDTVRRLDKAMLIKWGICLLVSTLPLFFSVNETYTHEMKLFFCITLLGITLLAFELLSGFAIAILMATLWILTGVCDYTTAFSSWSSSTAMIIICALFMVNVLQDVGLLKRIGYWCIIHSGGTFNSIVWCLFFTSVVINAIGFVMTSALTYAFAYALYKALDLKPTDKESVVIVGATIMGGIQSSVFLYCPLTVPIINTATQQVLPNFELYWYQAIYYGIPVLGLCILFIVGLLKWYKHQSVKAISSAEAGKEYFTRLYQELGPISKEEKKGAAILLVAIIILFTQPLHKLDAAFSFMIAGILFCLPGMGFKTAQAIRNVPWESSVFIVLGFLAVGTVGMKVGVNNLLASALIPIVSSMGTYWSVLGTFVMSAVSNLVLTPFAMLAMLPIPVTQYCLDAGYNALPHLLAIYQARDMVFFPYEYPMYLILFSFGMVKMGTMIKICSIKAIAFLLFFIVAIMPAWYLMGIIY